MIVELRQYWAKPGMRDALVELMETRILPMQVSKGVHVVGSFVAVDDPDAYVWMRSWESEEERERVGAAVYESPEWLDDLKPAVGAIMDREKMVVTSLVPTPSSPIG